MGQTVGRFAPSPSGRIHLGNILSSLLAWLSARSQGGRIVLRLEDLDTVRCPRRYALQLEEDLRWLGLDWDEGGTAGRGTHGPYEQSRRTELYQAALERLEEKGLVYPCFCTRRELHAAAAPHRSDGRQVYPGTCRELTAEEVAARLAAGRRAGMRLRVPNAVIGFTDGHLGWYEENLAEACGDFLLRRSDGLFAYQLAVVVDDAAMGVTEVVRGADLLDSTPRQLLLYRLLGLPEPRFYHLPLLLSADGRRLSKRDRDMDLGELSRRFRPEEIIGRLAFLAGLNPEVRPCRPEELAADFAWDKVPREDLTVPPALFGED
jgi:glutamyl-tRNA synthetase